MKTNRILMVEARESLVGKWRLAVLTVLVYLIIFIAISVVPRSGLMSLIIAGPFALGLSMFWLEVSRKHPVHTDMIFSGFKNFSKALGLYSLKMLFILLWSLLLIVPGIIASLSYSMAFYLMIDHPHMQVREALTKSKSMMYGHKWKLFCLDLRFVGWFLLSIISLGIGFLWLIPYVSVAYAKFYDDLKESMV